MQQIKEDQFSQAYELLRSSFSKGELRTYDDLKQKYEEGKIHINILKDGDTIQGVCAFWNVLEYTYIEYLCIDKKYQNLGLGSKILQAFNDGKVILEVSKIEDEESKKRVQFYERNNFHYYPIGFQQPALHEVLNTHDLHVMSCPNAVDEKEYERIISELFAYVYACER